MPVLPLMVVLVGILLCQPVRSADHFDALCRESPVIVRAKILKLQPGSSISDVSKEFRVEAEVFDAAKGGLKPKERISIVIKLPMKDHDLLRDAPFGMREGGEFILFLRPRFSSDGETLLHYRFTETPLGCLPHDFYSWERVRRASLPVD